MFNDIVRQKYISDYNAFHTLDARIQYVIDIQTPQNGGSKKNKQVHKKKSRKTKKLN